LSGTLRRRGGSWATGVDWLDMPGEDEVLVRLSRALGLPRGWPDVLGLALRIPTGPASHGDLLFATTGTGALSRFLLRPTRAEPQASRYTTLLPYRTPSGPLLLAAQPAAAERHLELSWATPTGRWHPFAELTLPREPTGDEPEPLVSFDPMLNVIPGLVPYDWHRRLREYAYAGARQAREHRGGGGGDRAS